MKADAEMKEQVFLGSKCCLRLIASIPGQRRVEALELRTSRDTNCVVIMEGISPAIALVALCMYEAIANFRSREGRAQFLLQKPRQTGEAPAPAEADGLWKRQSSWDG